MPSKKDPVQGVWEERWHPLREEWVILAAHREDRPWQGETVQPRGKSIPSYEPDCYLCPGNRRVHGDQNPAYEGVYVFDNDLPCVGPDSPASFDIPPGPYRSRRAEGIARVICYSPRHDLTLAEMETEGITEVARVWQRETHDLILQPSVEHILIFENKGEAVGVSNPHPHGQVYATNFVFKTVEIELNASLRYSAQTGRSLFQDILEAEITDGRRLLYEDEHTIAFVPYFARYAYEVYVAPKRTVPLISLLTEVEVLSLARALKEVTVRFDNLWRQSFPYVMPLHQAPNAAKDCGCYHFYIAFHPPLRRPRLMKYLAGPEIGGGNFLSDSSPEDKAAELRTQETVHYKVGPDSGGRVP